MKQSAEAVRRNATLIPLILAVIGLLVQGCAGPSRSGSRYSRSGEYGGDLDYLRRAYLPPAKRGESNHLIELSQFRGDGTWKEFLAMHGLTNNHALIIASHGRAIAHGLRSRYVYSVDKGDFAARSLEYSAKDLATVLGPAAKQIDNIIIAGCNTEGAFNPEELRRWFVNATNVTYAPPQKLASETAFKNALIYRSRDIKFLFAMPDGFKVGRFDNSPVEKATSPTPYIASLYLPHAKKPFRTEIAGRELLRPDETDPGLTLTVPWPDFPMQAWPRD
jgi:hypothetical protein